MNLIHKLKEANYEALSIVGPTASGKTGFSLYIANRLPIEIISCDSMQIYKCMDIATAKATEAERRAVPHHMIDICSLSESYSSADYQRDASACAKGILERGRFPVFCGGTGLYLDAVMRGGYPEETESNAKLRQELSEYYNLHGAEALHKMLCSLDAEAAEKIHKNNVKRVMRAIEIAKSTGLTKTEYDRQNSDYRGLRVFVACLNFRNRETLYSRIDKRVEQMLSEGLLEEAEALMQREDFLGNQTALGAIGYKELFPYIRGEGSLCDCIEALKIATRRYAKRQLTWFLHRDYTHVLWVDKENGELKTNEELFLEMGSLL